jgi:hypothetical protein
MADDLQGAAVKYLLNIPEVVAAVGKFDLTQKPFIFRDEILVNLESGEYQAVSAIVIEDAGPVATMMRSRFRARRLRMTIWANGTRDAGGRLVSSSSVRLKINDTFNAVDKYLNRVDGNTVQWSSLYTVVSERMLDLSEPIGVTDGDGLMIASAYYGVYF